jgi:hypothetical protein
MVGSQLAQYLLLIVGGSIIVFVLYLVALDGVTSNEVTQVYNQTFQQMRDITIPHDAGGADDAAKILQGASRFATTQVSTADAEKIRSVVEQLKKSGRLIGPNATRLDQCVQFVAKPANTATSTGAKQTTSAKKDAKGQKNETVSQGSPTPAVQPSPPAAAQPSQTATVEPSPTFTPQSSPTITVEPSPIATAQPSLTPTATPSPNSETRDQSAQQNDAADRTKAFEECVQILDPLRQVSASQAIELDRLRMMKEYAKGAHDHRQAFRLFWLQAAQLVLLNLLLPLLTALLGYIFGSREH